ncbi:Asp23/Gls24 family envelope stress response protein [Streptomonospora wellingtoniae]|uniref:Asp23/Gls24 family envelope stress response protein n=1 Tax=Streptomonospora wellingtoniae TaxID=3075544 RepID=A0ABU2KQM7_9ACTN|nr:Asp23/Gls24 family envelope stress response protein [Streptomonospora sp. DSM 45055]MDT0301575.1 Asp23/Gls24 family envelope stress response protein [Streptomonospora sp. DSM 45055]
MTETTSEATVPGAREGTPSGAARTGSRDPVSGSGRTSIADHVVAKIAGMAAREVGGVYRLGGGASRPFGAVRDRVAGGANTGGAARGVAVEVGERQTALDIDLVVEYGVAIPDLAAAVRRNVIAAVEHMTGLEVTEANIAVDDIHLPDDDSGAADDSEPRVQ